MISLNHHVQWGRDLRSYLPKRYSKSSSHPLGNGKHTNYLWWWLGDGLYLLYPYYIEWYPREWTMSSKASCWRGWTRPQALLHGLDLERCTPVGTASKAGLGRWRCVQNTINIDFNVIYIYIFLHVYKYMHIKVCMCVCICIYLYDVNLYACIYACMHVCVHVCVCM